MAASAGAAETKHTFTLSTNDFLLDGKPFQIRAGEIHPNRVPKEYWRQRIQMAKAMGLNTISSYVFWSYHEVEEGRFDFKTWNRDIGAFLQIAKEEGMWVSFRPGPYCCGEYDFGAIPTYLLRYPDLKIRCMDTRYMAAVERYLRALAAVIRPYQITNGGPILMVQIENEYGSYPPGHDRKYLERLCAIWRDEKIEVPFYTADGASEHALTTGMVPGGALGMDPGTSEAHWAVAKKVNPHVPAFCSEVYPGWLMHWGKKWNYGKNLHNELKFYMDSKKSFALYMFHGGSNWGFMAGANSGGSGYEPDITSYDYGSPVDEQGRATQHYMTMRQQLAAYLPAGEKLPDIPESIPAMRIPKIEMKRWTSLWDQLPASIKSEQVKTFETLGQNQGLMLYRTRLKQSGGGQLVLRHLHDYALVFLDGKYIGTLNRCKGQNALDLPATDSAAPVLDILVEGMGHINFAAAMTADRKGITEQVTLDKTPLTNWEIFPFPLDEKWAMSLRKTAATGNKPGGVFRGVFNLDTFADTFLDMSRYQKGYVWVNGHNLGRYWNIGPQYRLYCPAPWLKKGRNEIVVLDLHQTEPQPVCGMTSHNEKKI